MLSMLVQEGLHKQSCGDLLNSCDDAPSSSAGQLLGKARVSYQQLSHTSALEMLDAAGRM